MLGLPCALPDPPPCACSLVAPPSGAAPLPLVRCSGVGLSAALGAPVPPAPSPLFHLYMHAVSISICNMLCGIYVCKPVRLRFAWLRYAPCGRLCRKVVRQWVYAHCYPKKRRRGRCRAEFPLMKGLATPAPFRRAARCLALALAVSLVRSLLRSLSCARLRFAWLRALGSLGSLPLSFLAVRSARLGVGGLPLG